MDNISGLAPIILFVYNRPFHTMQTLEALADNRLSKYSDLIIYSDAPKNEQAKDSVLKVRDYLNELKIQNDSLKRFASVEIVHRESNFGLADSIIDGVSSVMKKYGRAIVLEDDIVVSHIFLDYMNEALNVYKDTEKVWSISAWSMPIDSNNMRSCYFFRAAYCWGWASWEDRWQHYKRDVDWALKNFDEEDIYHINIDGAMDFWEQVLANKSGAIKSWAIFWYLIAYKHNALTLCPTHSYIKQIGFDGTGVHCGHDGNHYNREFVNTKLPLVYPKEIIESSLALHKIRQFEIERKQKTLKKRIAKLKRNIINGVIKRTNRAIAAITRS